MLYRSLVANLPGVAVTTHSCLGFGSRRSLSPSPNRLNARTTRAMANLGNSDSHQTLVIFPRLTATIWPQDGIGGGMPTPKKLSDASARMTASTCRVHSNALGFSYPLIRCDQVRVLLPLTTPGAWGPGRRAGSRRRD
jgi:hypothetical protein